LYSLVKNNQNFQGVSPLSDLVSLDVDVASYSLGMTVTLQPAKQETSQSNHRVVQASPLGPRHGISSLIAAMQNIQKYKVCSQNVLSL
jgi:hypothetical protein